ncbi:MAG: Hcp family type VI secretion system effector [Terriglobia bacterium]
MDTIIMDIPSIPGECKVKGYEKKIELLSYSHGVAMQITGDQSNAARTSGKPNHQDFTVTKFLDIASVPSYDACNKATKLGAITITVGRNDNGTVLPFIVYELGDTLLSSVSIGGGGGGKPQETLTLNYTTIKWTYSSQKPEMGKEGEAKANWSLEANASQ